MPDEINNLFDLMLEMQAPHCFEDGPDEPDGCGTTCMLEEGHEEPHQWVRDDEIIVTFKEAGED